MRRFENQTGDPPPKRRAGGLGELPMLLVLLAIFSVTLLSLAAVQVASAAVLDQPPMRLPADAGISASGPGSGSQSWIVGGVPGRRTARIAERYGATVVSASLGSYRIPRDRADRLAAGLREAELLVYAEPDVGIERDAYPADLMMDQQRWLDQIVNPADVTPPAVTRRSPLIALIEESLDPQHPDLLHARLSRAKSLGPEADTHGTSVAGIAGSPGEGLGIRGVWPGARMRLFPSGLSCASASKAVTRAARRKAAVINMSYTFPADSCFTHFMATQLAVRKGAVLVASAGNSGASGNARMRPATDPHVLAVGAVDEAGIVAPFSTRNAAVDITAPGVGVWAPVVSPGPDGVVRDWQPVSGTSFSAPMVSAAAAWLAQARPRLGNLQIARLLTSSATDLGEPGRDARYGDGLLNIEKSLTGPHPPADPYEPNDGIRWADGSLLRRKTPYLWRAGKGKRRVLRATLSRAKDPVDVYRVRIPARRRIVAHVNQLEGDIVLSALKPSAKSISGRRRDLIVRSNRPYPKTEGIVVRNLKRRAQSIWLVITPSATQTGNDSTYRIKVARR